MNFVELLNGPDTHRALRAGERATLEARYALPVGAREGHGAIWISGPVEILADYDADGHRVRALEGCRWVSEAGHGVGRPLPSETFVLIDPITVEISK